MWCLLVGLVRFRPSACLENAAVRLIAGARKFYHVTRLLRKKHWLPVEQRITFKMAVMTYKCVHGTTADYLADYIRPPSPASAKLHLRSTSSGRLFVPRSKTAAGDRSFAVAGSRLWNSLPTSITSVIFKNNLRLFYLEQHDFSVNSVKRLRSDLSLTTLYKLT